MSPLRVRCVLFCSAMGLTAAQPCSADEVASRQVSTRVGSDGRTRPVPGLIAGGAALALLGTAGLLTSSLVLVSSTSDEASVAAGVGLGASFVSLGVGTAMVIVGAPRQVSYASSPTHGVATGVSVRASF